jgi:hypothetical protein
MTFIKCWMSKDWNNLHQAESQKIGITFIRYDESQKIGITSIRCWKSKDWNNLHQVCWKSIFWLSAPGEGYSNVLSFSTWWRLFQSFDFQHLMKVIPIFWFSAYLMKVIPIKSQKIGITFIRCWKSKDSNNRHQVCWKSKDWNNLHQAESQKIGITFIRLKVKR